jgi:hypothetical protein
MAARHNAMEDNDGGECNPTYIDRRTKGRGVVASSFWRETFQCPGTLIVDQTTDQPTINK